VPASTRDHRRAVAYQLGQPLVRLHNIGLPEQAIGELLKMWHEGLVHQLVNYPADLRIERWLRENYPGLNEPQEASIRYSLGENRKMLARSTQGFTAPKVYDASATMNAAFARYMARLYQDEKMAGRFQRSAYWAEGMRLADDIWSTEDLGHKSDVESAREWAKLFGIDGWFEWRHADLVQAVKR